MDFMKMLQQMFGGQGSTGDLATANPSASGGITQTELPQNVAQSPGGSLFSQNSSDPTSTPGNPSRALVGSAPANSPAQNSIMMSLLQNALGGLGGQSPAGPKPMPGASLGGNSLPLQAVPQLQPFAPTAARQPQLRY